MLTLKISNSSCQPQHVDNSFGILVPRGFCAGRRFSSRGFANANANEIEDLAASTISGGAAIGVVTTAEGFGDATVWTIASSKSTPESAEGMGLITIGTTPSVPGTSYRFEIGGKSIEFPLSNFFKQKFEGLRGTYYFDRSFLNYLFAR